ncbi:MAG: hypothetical protein K8U57_00295 [Planctomycetes bacterium]|nr:hypothetical protein [Planctomycetota bacterium]
MTLAAWKKVLLFGLFGAVGCLAGWAVGEVYLLAARAIVGSGSGTAPTLISRPTAPATDAPPPSSEFKDRLDREKAKTGDVQISLIWFNKNDLDLHCVDPNGAKIFFKQPRSASGGELDVDANGDRGRPVTSEPVENIYWASGTAPSGKYTVSVNYYNRRPGEPNATTYKVSILHGGSREDFSGEISDNGTSNNERLIREFELSPKVELFAASELEVPPGVSLKVPVVARRMYYKGEIKVQAENLPDGVTAEPLTIPEGKTDGELVLKASESAKEVKRSIKLVGTGGGLTGSADTQLTIPAPAVRFSATTVIILGIWTALLAVGLCLALMAGQNHYLGRPLFAAGRIPLTAVIVGAIVAGFVSGSVGQSLYSVLLVLSIGSFGLVVGWVLLGGLLGWGVSFFVSNLDKKRAALAGLAGGLLGAIAFLVGSNAGDWLGRLIGAGVLGFCIGLVVAIVEAAFRRAWLEVRFGERETINVNLGPEPVKVGGNSQLCTVWARGAPDVAFRFFVRNSQVICEDTPTRTEAIVGEGHTRTAGNVTLTVHTGGAAVPMPQSPKPVATSQTALPATPQAAAPPPAPPPVPVPAPAPVAKAPPAPDYDDNLPMPISPPPPARPKVASILDDDGFVPPTKPQAAAPVKPPMPAPVATKPPAPSMSAKPPMPASPKPAPPAVPKPPTPAPPAVVAPTTDAKPAGEGCPTCKRVAPGRPGARYCMMCDKPY